MPLLAGRVAARDRIGIRRAGPGRVAVRVATLAVDIVVVETALLAGHRVVRTAGILLAGWARRISLGGRSRSGGPHVAAAHRSATHQSYYCD